MKNKTCKIVIKRGLIGMGSIKKITMKNCNDKQVSNVFKKRNFNINDVNLIKY